MAFLVYCPEKARKKEGGGGLLELIETFKTAKVGRKSDQKTLIFCTNRRRTNVQQLTCKIDSSRSFYYLFFSFVLLELKPFVFKWKVLGEKF